ncbi:MAG: ribonucleotide reductase subunit alpha [Eggerthellaceae bacterium]|nr:ribonucleotide reductase subunit alpha [Eggerthellaceae bacterium]
MFENDADANSSPNQNNNTQNDHTDSYAEYLARATQACDQGDSVLGMHLYLAAFERAAQDSRMIDAVVIEGMRRAWQLACQHKERSLAEYIFERLEPYLTSEEITQCASQLQKLALDKLEEFGLTKEDLEDMTEMISQDFNAGSLFGKGGQSGKLLSGSAQSPSTQAFLLPTLGSVGEKKSEPVLANPSYKDLIGFGAAIKTMQSFGVGIDDDPGFDEFVKTLHARHGLSRVPISDAFLFRCPAREDANQFMMATVTEMRLPSICMRMEENLQGMPVLCVMTSTNNQPHLNLARNAIEGAAVLVLEDIDLWGPPLSDFMADDMGAFFFSHLSRGAREAMNLIRSAIENPEVYVFMSAGEEEPIDEYFLDLLEPLTTVDVDLPTEKERADIWLDVARKHPSLLAIENERLVQYSSGMSRLDIFLAAREAVEEAYKASLSSRTYVPVTQSNIFEKIALYQPLESDEYIQLEDAVVGSFVTELDQIDDLLKGNKE